MLYKHLWICLKPEDQRECVCVCVIRCWRASEWALRFNLHWSIFNLIFDAVTCCCSGESALIRWLIRYRWLREDTATPGLKVHLKLFRKINFDFSLEEKRSREKHLFMSLDIFGPNVGLTPVTETSRLFLCFRKFLLHPNDPNSWGEWCKLEGWGE